MTLQALDIERIGAYLESKIAGFKGLVSAEKFSGGQSNPTFLLNADSGSYVLRSKPPGDLLKSAHAVDREYRVMQALADTDVPVARALHLCEDEGISGSMFYVMSYEDGRIFWDPALPELKKEQREDYHDELIRVLAALYTMSMLMLLVCLTTADRVTILRGKLVAGQNNTKLRKLPAWRT